MRYRIKARLADLGLKSVNAIEELKKYGLKTDQSGFSKAISGRSYGEMADKIAETADRIITIWEKERGIK